MIEGKWSTSSRTCTTATDEYRRDNGGLTAGFFFVLLPKLLKPLPSPAVLPFVKATLSLAAIKLTKRDVVRYRLDKAVLGLSNGVPEPRPQTAEF